MKYYLDPDWQNSMKIRLDYNNMMSRIIGDEHGLTFEQINSISEIVEKVHEQIQNKTGKGNDFLGFLSLPEIKESEINKIKEVANKLADTSDIFITLGIGGSYLGAKALVEALNSPYYNELTRENRNKRPRIYFEGNNIDSDSLNYLFDLLPDTKPLRLENDFSLSVISKSGATIETAVAFRLFQEKTRKIYGDKHNEHIVAITDQSKGKLKAIADKENYQTFVIPDDVGGRYSVLTPVGLFPAAVVGVDIEELLAGARYMRKFCENSELAKNPAYMYAALQYLSSKKGRNISVMACWSKALENIGFWYDQLCAESLGKEQKGRAPITIVDTRDLHSRGQQLQEGEQNTVVTNLFVENSNREIIFKKDDLSLDDLNYLDGKSLKSMLLGAMEGTNYAYAKAQRPTMNVILPQINAFTLGQLFYLFEVATVAEGYMMEINPLDQPGVEAYKKFMFANLGREDMKKYKEEFDAREKAEEDFII